MSLSKQLWLAVLTIISLTFLSGFLISSLTARNYYEEQLRVKNNDAANAMAMSLSTLDKDPTVVALTLSAQFDTGHYQSIRLQGAEGGVLYEKYQEAQAQDVPLWFSRLIRFEIPVGVAQVQDGWNIYGTVYVESASDYALAALWRVSIKLLFWFALIAIACGLLGSYFLRFVNRPLDKVVAQAEALGERRFITSDEPKTLEFQRLVRAMNRLTERVKVLFETEAKHLDELQQQTQTDPVLGIVNRDTFIKKLNSRLQGSEPCQDVLLLLRIQSLQEMNQKHGRGKIDDWLKNLVACCRTVLNRHNLQLSSYEIGRLNGVDLTLSIRDCAIITPLAQDIIAEIQQNAALEGFDLPVRLVGCYHSNNLSWAELMPKLDALLANIEEKDQPLLLSTESEQGLLFADANEWREALQQALDNKAVSIECFPCLKINGELLHEEALLRIQLNGKIYSARSVLGWARRVGLLPALELKVLQLALDYSVQHRRPVAVNVSLSSLLEQKNYAAVSTLLKQYRPEQIARLAFEVDEYAVLKEPVVFASFAVLVKGLGIGLGLQAAGHRLAQIHNLQSLGFEYIKVDSALVQSCAEPDTQRILRSIAKLAHSLGLILVADGTPLQADLHCLNAVGFDAISGPYCQDFKV